jgi:hypothetical protein
MISGRTLDRGLDYINANQREVLDQWNHGGNIGTIADTVLEVSRLSRSGA